MAGTERDPRPRRVRLRRAAVAAFVVVALSATVIAQPWASRAPSASPAPATSSPGPRSSPGGDWEGLVLDEIPAVAALAASDADVAGVRPDATFALTSLTAEPAAALAARLEINPPTEYAVAPGADAGGAVITPSAALTPGVLYRFALRAQDGTLAGSWAFRVRSPLHVLATIPGDQTTAVPVRTGIEVTFDQEGAADMADQFTISPAVEGRFERHGRTQVFVPLQLQPATLYTVTIRAGLPREGTDLALESAVTFRFETEGPSRAEPWLRFGRDVVEASPAEPPLLAVEAVQPNVDAASPTPPTSADVVVYRLASLVSATDALRSFLAAPRWAEHADPLMPTDRLPVAARFTATLEPLRDSPFSVVRFPTPLDEGWYIVEAQGPRRSQAFLQVTPVAAWVSVLTDRTVAWVNDVTTGRPIRGAGVSIAGGAAIGEADGSGLMVGATPDVLLPAAEAGDRAVPEFPPVLAVRSPAGETLLVPFGVGWDGGIYRGEWWEKSGAADSTYWSLLLTERTLYRTTDRIAAWGYLRGRDDDAVPAAVELRLISAAWENLVEQPALTRAVASPDAHGAFTAELALNHVPFGAYRLLAISGGRVVASRWLEVGIIRKPAYELAIAPDRLAVISGTEVTWTTTATFFDGAPMPSLRVTVSSRDDQVAADPTDTAGHTPVGLTARSDENAEDANFLGADVRPSGPEEGEIYASAGVLVFPSDYHLEASGIVEDGRLRVTGSLDRVDLAKVEAKLAADEWNGDPDGSPVARASIRATVTELVPVKRLVGSDYDFIEKIVRPRYEYDIERTELRTLTLSSGSDGRIAFDLAVPDSSHQYEVVLSTPDAAGREARRTIQAGTAADLWWAGAGVQFQTETGEWAGSDSYRIGEHVRWRMTNDGEPLQSGGPNRYLYIVAQRGLRAASVTESATFDRSFEPADAPGIFIMGVRFTGTTYAPKAAAWAPFDEAQRAITVSISADRERYRPGEDATFTVRTVDEAGRPIAASVVLQAVDEKLFAMGGAEVPRPLQDLYARADSGIVRLTSTHQVPTQAGPEGEGGDTTGGGPRSDFRDTLAFRALETGTDGTATTTIRLSDDLTSWHVIAVALTAGIQAGAGELLVPVGLPLFVDATIADEYLASDRPTIRLRAFGEAVRAGDPVEFTITSSTLGWTATSVTGEALSDVSVALPALSLGSHSLDITVAAPTRLDSAGRRLSDRLIRRFEVVSSRLTTARSRYGLVGGGLPIVPGLEAAAYTFTDAGRGRYLPLLLGLAEPAGARLDRGLAQLIAHDQLVDVFGREPSSLPVVSLDPTRYPIGNVYDEGSASTLSGIALLPYGGPDPWLAARVALVAPEGVSAWSLREILADLAYAGSLMRDLRIASLAGLAGLGEPVMGDLRDALAATDLTMTERLHLALGFRALGDDATAREMERALLREHGEQLGPWVRVAGSTREETLEATSLMALLSAGLGDPLAPGMIDYVAANPTRESTHALELAGAARWALERTPAAAATFAYSVAGTRTVVRLAAGESMTVTLSAEQRSTLEVERVSGDVGLAVAWRAIVDASTIRPASQLRLTRTLPTSPVPTDRLVTVQLTATFGSDALESGCYEVVEEVPSGLAPVATSSQATAGTVIWPADIVGQRVTFCVPYGTTPDAGPTARLAYVARVINAGSFTWEPAVMQLGGVPEAIALTGGATTRIGGG